MSHSHSYSTLKMQINHVVKLVNLFVYFGFIFMHVCVCVFISICVCVFAYFNFRCAYSALLISLGSLTDSLGRFTFVVQVFVFLIFWLSRKNLVGSSVASLWPNKLQLVAPLLLMLFMRCFFYRLLLLLLLLLLISRPTSSARTTQKVFVNDLKMSKFTQPAN